MSALIKNHPELVLEYEKVLGEALKQLLPKKHHQGILSASPGGSLHSYFFAWQKMTKVFVPPVHFNIHESPALAENLLIERFRERYKLFKDLLAKGDLSINSKSRRYLSEYSYMIFNSREDPSKRLWHDRLYTSWGIKHFHLSLNRKNDDALLYVHLGQQDAYILDAGGHARMTDPALLEIIDANWPQLLNGKWLNTVGPECLTPEQIKNLWQNGYNCAPSINGKAFSGFDFQSSAGTPLSVQMRFDRALRILSNIENELQSPFSELTTQMVASSQRHSFLKVPFAYEITPNRENFWGALHLREINNNILVRVPLPAF